MKAAQNISRIFYVDFLKAVALFCVIFYHCFTASVDVTQNNPVNFLNYFIKSCICICIPVFFLINGGLLFSKKLILKKHMHKMVSLIFLTAAWDILDVTLKMLLLYQPLTVKEYLRKLWFFEPGWSNQLWFLMALFVVYAFFPLFKSAYDHSRTSLLFLGILTAVIVLGNSTAELFLRATALFVPISLPQSSPDFFNQFNPIRGLYGYTILYFLLGGLLLPYADTLRNKFRSHKSAAVIGFLLSVLLLTLYGCLATRQNGTIWDTVWDGFSSIFTLSATFFFFVLALNCPSQAKSRIQRCIQELSKKSLGIYLVQNLILDLLHPLYTKLPFSSCILQNVLLATVLMGLCYFLTSLLARIPYLRKLVTL